MKMIRRLMSTVDQTEALKFTDYKWWSRNNALHPFSDLRVLYIKSRLNIPRLDGLKILDVGCGGGILSERLGRLGADVLGIDPSQEAIEVARSHLPRPLKSRVRYENCEVSDLDDKEKFDVVVASEVIEHVTSPQEFIGQISKKAKPQSSIFLTTINRTLESWVVGILVSEYLLKIVEPGTHDWQKFVTPEELKNYCEINKVKVLHQQGWGIDYCSFSAFFMDYSRIGYLVHCVRENDD